MIELKDQSVIVTGGMTLDTVPRLVDAVTGYIADGVRNIDLSGVTEVDSSAVALLLEWQRQASGRGASPLTWTGIPEALENLAELYGVRGLLQAEA